MLDIAAGPLVAAATPATLLSIAVLPVIIPALAWPIPFLPILVLLILVLPILVRLILLVRLLPILDVQRGLSLGEHRSGCSRKRTTQRQQR